MYLAKSWKMKINTLNRILSFDISDHENCQYQYLRYDWGVAWWTRPKINLTQIVNRMVNQQVWPHDHVTCECDGLSRDVHCSNGNLCIECDCSFGPRIVELVADGKQGLCPQPPPWPSCTNIRTPSHHRRIRFGISPLPLLRIPAWRWDKGGITRNDCWLVEVKAHMPEPPTPSAHTVVRITGGAVSTAALKMETWNERSTNTTSLGLTR